MSCAHISDRKQNRKTIFSFPCKDFNVDVRDLLASTLHTVCKITSPILERGFSGLYSILDGFSENEMSDDDVMNSQCKVTSFRKLTSEDTTFGSFEVFSNESSSQKPIEQMSLHEMVHCLAEDKAIAKQGFQSACLNNAFSEKGKKRLCVFEESWTNAKLSETNLEESQKSLCGFEAIAEESWDDVCSLAELRANITFFCSTNNIPQQMFPSYPSENFHTYLDILYEDPVNEQDGEKGNRTETHLGTSEMDLTEMSTEVAFKNVDEDSLYEWADNTFMSSSSSLSQLSTDTSISEMSTVSILSPLMGDMPASPSIWSSSTDSAISSLRSCTSSDCPGFSPSSESSNNSSCGSDSTSVCFVSECESGFDSDCGFDCVHDVVTLQDSTKYRKNRFAAEGKIVPTGCTASQYSELERDSQCSHKSQGQLKNISDTRDDLLDEEVSYNFRHMKKMNPSLSKWQNDWNLFAVVDDTTVDYTSEDMQSVCCFSDSDDQGLRAQLNTPQLDYECGNSCVTENITPDEHNSGEVISAVAEKRGFETSCSPVRSVTNTWESPQNYNSHSCGSLSTLSLSTTDSDEYRMAVSSTVNLLDGSESKGGFFGSLKRTVLPAIRRCFDTICFKIYEDDNDKGTKGRYKRLGEFSETVETQPLLSCPSDTFQELKSCHQMSKAVCVAHKCKKDQLLSDENLDEDDNKSIASTYPDSLSDPDDSFSDVTLMPHSEFDDRISEMTLMECIDSGFSEIDTASDSESLFGDTDIIRGKQNIQCTKRNIHPDQAKLSRAAKQVNGSKSVCLRKDLPHREVKPTVTVRDRVKEKKAPAFGTVGEGSLTPSSITQKKSKLGRIQPTSDEIIPFIDEENSGDHLDTSAFLYKFILDTQRMIDIPRNKSFFDDQQMAIMSQYHLPLNLGNKTITDKNGCDLFVTSFQNGIPVTEL